MQPLGGQVQLQVNRRPGRAPGAAVAGSSSRCSGGRVELQVQRRPGRAPGCGGGGRMRRGQWRMQGWRADAAATGNPWRRSGRPEEGRRRLHGRFGRRRGSRPPPSSTPTAPPPLGPGCAVAAVVVWSPATRLLRRLSRFGEQLGAAGRREAVSCSGDGAARVGEDAGDGERATKGGGRRRIRWWGRLRCGGRGGRRRIRRVARRGGEAEAGAAAGGSSGGRGRG